jgi:hypothetical protein
MLDIMNQINTSLQFVLIRVFIGRSKRFTRGKISFGGWIEASTTLDVSYRYRGHHKEESQNMIET